MKKSTKSAPILVHFWCIFDWNCTKSAPKVHPWQIVWLPWVIHAQLSAHPYLWKKTIIMHPFSSFPLLQLVHISAHLLWYDQNIKHMHGRNHAFLHSFGVFYCTSMLFQVPYVPTCVFSDLCLCTSFQKNYLEMVLVHSWSYSWHWCSIGRWSSSLIHIHAHIWQHTQLVRAQISQKHSMYVVCQTIILNFKINSSSFTESTSILASSAWMWDANWCQISSLIQYEVTFMQTTYDDQDHQLDWAQLSHNHSEIVKQLLLSVIHKSLNPEC